MVTGSGSRVGTPLMGHQDVGIVSFTGSTEVGRKVSEACAPAFKHCHLEMGGKNVIMVMDDARLDLAVEGALWGGFGTTGQRCTAASRVVVHEKVYAEFVERFVAGAQGPAGRQRARPEDADGPVRQRVPARDRRELRQDRQGRGGEAARGRQPALDRAPTPRATSTSPRSSATATRRCASAREEIFGPVVSVIPVGSLEEAIEVGNSVEYGLSASIYTQDVNKAFTAMREMYTGIFYVNAPTIGAETHLPFGGTKNTGNGHREACVQALDVFSEWKSIYIDFSGKLQRAQID